MRTQRLLVLSVVAGGLILLAAAAYAPLTGNESAFRISMIHDAWLHIVTVVDIVINGDRSGEDGLIQALTGTMTIDAGGAADVLGKFRALLGELSAGF